MCINIANEQLQHYFNEHIFSWELEECKRENIDCESITYSSNYPIVQLFLEVKMVANNFFIMFGVCLFRRTQGYWPSSTKRVSFLELQIRRWPLNCTIHMAKILGTSTWPHATEGPHLLLSTTPDVLVTCAACTLYAYLFMHPFRYDMNLMVI